MNFQDENGKRLWESFREKFSAKPTILSSYSSYALDTDLKHFLFYFSRYKFVAKMLENKRNLVTLELGCNDGLGMLMIQQTGLCKNLIGVDFDSDSIKWASKNIKKNNMIFVEEDFLGKKYIEEGADVVYSLDVIEHIDKSLEDEFLNTVASNLKKNGFAIIGTPNERMYQYTSEINKEAHVNNYTQEKLYKLLSKKFHNVFLFGMNDEVLHTGFYPMTCYIMALCCNKK